MGTIVLQLFLTAVAHSSIEFNFQKSRSIVWCNNRVFWFIADKS